MDVRLSAEQTALREAVGRAMDRLAPHSVAELADSERSAKLNAAVAAAGWTELRVPTKDGTPWASAVEVALVAEELGRGLADAPFWGPTMAAELRRLARAPIANGPESVLLTADLSQPARAEGGALPPGALAVDAGPVPVALTLVPGADGDGIGLVELVPAGGLDLTRPSACPATGASAQPLDGARPLGAAERARWQALGLSAACADLVGVMRGTIALAADYARSRRQYGVKIGSFQSVQHLLADALVAMEGSRSIALYAAWAVDALDVGQALAAATGAKAYCARAARAVCETAVQVHGGIGNTWDCLAHVYLRRALLSCDVLGGVGPSLDRVLVAHGIGGDDGLR